MNKASNVVLIGMPTAGKSTIGKLLANKLNWRFIDTDDLIEQDAGMSCQAIADNLGYQHLRQLEEKVILDLKTENTVIATGGSAVYSSDAISHLADGGVIIYLSITLESMKERLPQPELRGLAERKGTTISELYQKRKALYEGFADFEIATDHVDEPQTVESLLAKLSLQPSSADVMSTQ